MERYAERILTSIDNVAQYIADNEEKIQNDINLMIQYGDFIAAKKDEKGEIDVYMRHNWVLLVDEKRQKVITLYKIDFGFGDDFNNEFIARSMEKINDTKKEYDLAVSNCAEKARDYKDLISDNEKRISDLRAIVNKLNEQNENYRSLIKLIDTEKEIQQHKLNEAIGDLIQRKEF